ncbi:hypothetical protein D6850_08165 [Roseovarius spongiae]|uniref:Uncharacterized protein n=1 Tax=Roseovarius spongiae TaxID=2320272 RepID=A0A3A8AUU4_9RHOB|nr:DUF6476 family protein [Roseovarius spongiae]RKF14838.1 hypothetical protein D6850_08165 [Roseovarius spongiae]
MNDTPQPQPVDAGLVRYLRLLVTILTATMVIGFIVIVVLFVTRFSDAFGPEPPDLPETIALPDGAAPLAFTQGGDWFAVVTTEDEVLIFDRATGELRQTIAIESQ